MGEMDVREATIAAEAGPERLDRALARAFPDMSRNRLQVLVREGQVRVDGVQIADPKRKVGPGAALLVFVPPAAAAEPLSEDIPLQVVYEDDDLIVIDKPAGLVVHPAAGHETGTLVNALINHCGDSLSGIGGVRRPGIVHRLDKDTSGLMVIAKNDAAHKGLAAQFADHGRTGSLQRTYIALVWGVPGKKRGIIDAALARSVQNREKIAIVPSRSRLSQDDNSAPRHGRHAVTHYNVEEIFLDETETPLVSMVRCVLETGRTHQIRVHMAHIGHPLLGDRVYGAGFRTKATKLTGRQQDALEALGRQALHAAVLGFEHPARKEEMYFESPLPTDMSALAESLRRK